MKAVFTQMETEVDQCSIDKKCLEIQKKELLLENDKLLEQILSQDIVCTVMHSSDILVDNCDIMQKSYVDEYNECKSVSECAEAMNMSKVIALGMYKLDLKPLSPKLKQNREAHLAYLKQTNEHANILQWIVEQTRALKPLDNDLDYACKFATRVYELLEYVSATCRSSKTKSEKLVAVTPINMNRKVRFVEPSTSTSNTQKQVDLSKTKDTHKPLVPSTGVISYTNASGSNPRSNSRKNRISHASSSNLKNKKVEDHPRNIKTSLDNKNRVSICNASTKHDVLQIVLWYLDPGCSKHVTGQHSQLINFVSKFLGTVIFGNDQVAVIMGYGDYQIGNVTILRVYYVEGLGHNSYSMGQFCDSYLDVAF
ncbi:hypothetical protein Tco_0937000 [Tanacetum coccineum]|uniref:Retrovirus-related Pol polyprotein from transposon TNT 1-94-like beta-barrel domain-containing protein n=1 Tax=Tanacetum coccineum TaxID=301880 RepID=A0ABQ5DDV0_9ASTR